MKQTAVDWIVSKLSITFQTMYSEEIEQAKEMEKEQIKEAYQDGSRDLDIQYSDVGEINSEQYYNETYGEK
jgi:hypothetical protein